MRVHRIDPETVMADQIPLHSNESSQKKTLNFKGAVQTTYVKKNDSLSRERITVITSVASQKSSSAPNLEFVFKGAVKRVKLSPPSVTLQWAPKGSYRLEHKIKFCDQVPAQPCVLFPQRRKIFTLDGYSVHLDPSIKEALKKRGYFIILPGGITGDLQVNDTNLHHDLKSYYRQKESLLMTEKLRSNPNKIPSPSRDEIMQMCKSAWNETVSKVDIMVFSNEMS